MENRLTFRQKLLARLALYYDRSQKQIGARIGRRPGNVSQHLRRELKTELKDELFAELLQGIPYRPGAVEIETASLEALDGLEADDDLTATEHAVIEETVLAQSRLLRQSLTDFIRRSRVVPTAGYPQPCDLAAARLRAQELWQNLAGLSQKRRLAAVRTSERCQTWYLCERVCEETELQLAREVAPAAALARLAREIADRVRGPEGWCRRVQGLAAAAGPNVLRVAGELEAARAGLAEAKSLWESGSDPYGVLDPGRLLDLEASLCRDERRFDKALSLLEEALPISHHPGRVLIKRGFTYEVMGEYGRAVETLLQAFPRIDHQAEPRNWNIAQLNLANVFCHLSRHKEALDLVEEVRPLVAELGDKIDSFRILWLDGRIAAGLGRPRDARGLFAKARRKFAAEKMSYDVALLLLEEAVLLLNEGKTAEVKLLIQDLNAVFEDKGVHREALATLRLFHASAECENATVELARRVLAYLYRARYDQGLRFTSS
jgi:tetratricopeptide (TPR) repeat protein